MRNKCWMSARVCCTDCFLTLRRFKNGGSKLTCVVNLHRTSRRTSFSYQFYQMPVQLSSFVLIFWIRQCDSSLWNNTYTVHKSWESIALISMAWSFELLTRHGHLGDERTVVNWTGQQCYSWPWFEKPLPTTLSLYHSLLHSTEGSSLHHILFQ